MKRYRMFRVRFKACTDLKGSRVSIYDMRSNKRKIIDYNSDSCSVETAMKYLHSIGITIIGEVNASDDDFLLTENFTTPLR